MADQVITLRIRADGSAAVAGVKKVERELGGVGRSGAEGGRKASRGLRDVENSSDRAGKSINKAKGYLLGFVGAAAAVQAGRGIIRMADEYTNLASKIKLVTDSEEEAARVQKQVFAVAQETRSGLQSTGDLYVKLARSTRDMNLSQQKVLGITKTINQSFIVSGASAEEANAAIIQLGQGLASGALRGDEFNSVAEQAPIIMDLLAEHLGMTRGELRKFAAEGKITAETVVDALSGGAKTVADQYDQMQITIAGALQKVKNAVAQSIGEASASTGGANALANAINAIAENMDSVINAVVLLGKIIVAVYVGKMLKNGAAWITSLQVQTTETVALGNASAAAGAKQVTGIKASIKSVGKLRAAGSLLMAAFVGWSIGKYLRDQFMQVRVAAVYFVDSTLSGWERIKQGALIMWEVIKHAGQAALSGIKTAIGAVAAGFGGLIQRLPEKLGGDSALANQLVGFGESMMSAGRGGESLAGAIARINKESDKAVAAVHKTTGEMVDYEYAQDAAKKSTDKLSKSAESQGKHIEVLDKNLADAGADSKKLAKDQKDAGKSISDYDKLMERVSTRTQGYQDKLDGLTSAQSTARDEIQEIVEQFNSGDIGSQQFADGIKAINEELGKATESGKDFSKSFDGKDAQKMSNTIAAIAGSSAYALRGIQTLAKDGSKEYEALNIAASALAAVEAVSAILSQGKGEPYSAFFRMAAMAAAVAPLLASIGKSISFAANSGFTDTAKQRQETQGTGSVLGDASAKSESIANATEITASATEKLVAINTGMLRALQQLQQSIGSASGLLARGAGEADFSGFDMAVKSIGSMTSAPGTSGRLAPNALLLGMPDLLGLFGGKSKITDQGIKIMGGALTDLINNIAVGAYQEVQSKSWAFGSTHTKEGFQKLDGGIATQFQLILESIADTVREGAKAIGIPLADIQQRIAAFQIATQNISLKDLSAEDQQKELEAVFSKIFDDLAGSVVPFVGQFQKVGEGLGETLVRVATEVQVTQEAVRQLGFALDTTDPEKFAQVADGLVTAAGGIDNFISGMQSFVSNFAPESVKFEQASVALHSALDQVNLSLPDTRDGMYALMQSLDATTEAGREQIATLLRLSDTADQYYKLQEKSVDELSKAVIDHATLIAGLQAETGLNPLAAKLLEIAKFGQDTSDKLNAMAIATGKAGASAKDLALVQEVAAQRGAAAIRALESASADLASQLGYTAADGATGALNGFSNAVSSFANNAKNSIDLLIGDLSPYNDRQKLDMALQGQRAGTVSPEQVLQIGRRLFASTSRYKQLFDQVQSIGDHTQAAQDSANYARTANATSTLVDKTLSKAERYQLADQLANNIADLASAQDISFADVADKLGFNLKDLGSDLGLTGDALNDYLTVLASDNFGLDDLDGILKTQVDRLIAAISGKEYTGPDALSAANAQPPKPSSGPLFRPYDPDHPDFFKPSRLPPPAVNPYDVPGKPYGGPAKSDPALLDRLKGLETAFNSLEAKFDEQGKLNGRYLPRIAENTERGAEGTETVARNTHDLVADRPAEPRSTRSSRLPVGA